MEADRDFYVNDHHPIDIAEDIAERRDWIVDRVGDDQIAFAVEGVWKTYSLSLAWYPPDETLRLVCTYEMQPPADCLGTLYQVIERANDRLWLGVFNLWRDPGLMVYRYGLTLRGGASATPEQVDAMMRAAVENSDRFYPAFQLSVWGGASAEEAISVALSEAVGRA